VKIGQADSEILRLWASENTFIWCKNCKNRTWFAFCLRHKIGCHGNVSWGIGKTGPDQENSHKYLLFGKKIVKIGPVDTEIALLKVKKRKKEEINASKIYIPSGKFPSGLKYSRLFQWLKVNTANFQSAISVIHCMSGVGYNCHRIKKTQYTAHNK